MTKPIYPFAKTPRSAAAACSRAGRFFAVEKVQQVRRRKQKNPRTQRRPMASERQPADKCRANQIIREGPQIPLTANLAERLAFKQVQDSRNQNGVHYKIHSGHKRQDGRAVALEARRQQSVRETETGACRKSQVRHVERDLHQSRALLRMP